MKSSRLIGDRKDLDVWPAAKTGWANMQKRVGSLERSSYRSLPSSLLSRFPTRSFFTFTCSAVVEHTFKGTMKSSRLIGDRKDLDDPYLPLLPCNLPAPHEIPDL